MLSPKEEFHPGHRGLHCCLCGGKEAGRGRVGDGNEMEGVFQRGVPAGIL